MFLIAIKNKKGALSEEEARLAGAKANSIYRPSAVRGK
jgi:hypothetical protein